MINPGKLIVIDGVDGSGKHTQSEILVNRLRAAGFGVEKAEFPQYNQKSAGLVENYLNGKYGTPEEVGAYRSSIFFACDRYDASFKIKRWLREGKIVIADRYVAANMGHQGGKIKDEMERKIYFNWLYDLEYKLFRIPEPDLNIILHVDLQIAMRLSQNGIRSALDIHEVDYQHLRNAQNAYTEIAQSFPGFKMIECSRNGRIMSREEIADLIWREISVLLNHYWIHRKDNDRIDVSRTGLHFAPNFINPRAPLRPDERNNKKIKIERISDIAKMPEYSLSGQGGLEIYAADYLSLYPGDRGNMRTGVRIGLPEDFNGFIWNIGGRVTDYIQVISRAIHTESGHELTVDMVNLGQDIYHIAPGQKIAEIFFQKKEKLSIDQSDNFI